MQKFLNHLAVNRARKKRKSQKKNQKRTPKRQGCFLRSRIQRKKNQKYNQRQA